MGCPINANGVENATNILAQADDGSWWIGRGHLMMRWMNIYVWGTKTFGWQLGPSWRIWEANPHKSYIDVMLQLNMKHLGCNKI